MSGLRPFCCRFSCCCYGDVRAPPLLLSFFLLLLRRCQGSAPFLVVFLVAVTKMSGLRPFSCCLLFCYGDVRAPPLLFSFFLFLLRGYQGSAPFVFVFLLLLLRCQGSVPDVPPVPFLRFRGVSPDIFVENIV